METTLGDSPKIKKALISGGGQSLIQMQGGSFFTEIRRGEGKILYCAIPPSPEWSTFPFTGLLPALIYRSLHYLSAKEMLTSEIISGDDGITMIPTKAMKNPAQIVKMIDPSGIESQVQGLTVPGGLSINMGRLFTPGVYAIKSKEQESLTAMTVNVPGNEGHLNYGSADEFSSALKNRMKAPSMLSILNQSDRIGESVAKAKIGTELWRFFLILAIVFAIAEMILARRVSTQTAEA
jgi:hypothetical protein